MVRSKLASLVALLLLFAACGGGASAPPTTGPAPTPSAQATAAPVSGPPGSGGSTTLHVGLGYIPSVQFAPFYLAQQAGYYRDAGLDVDLQYGNDPQILTLTGQGALDMGLSDGTSVIPAVSQRIPVKYAATIYARFPNVVIAKASSGIAKAADLKGKTLGTPAKNGSSWIMLQALLSSAKLTPDDLSITEYPDYGQGVALARDQVQSITGYTNNEAVQLRLQGIPITELSVDAITPLPGPGLVVGTRTLAAKPDALKAFVAATLRAMADITADPQKGVDAAIAAVPDLATNKDTQRAILDATIATWSNTATMNQGYGAIDPAAWQASVDFMRSLPDSVVASPVSVDQLITTELLP